MKKLFAAAVALALPLAGFAQTDEPAKPAAPKAEEGLKVTPYGFVLLNSFWDAGTLSNKDYPGQASRASEGGAFLMSARQSRFGFRLSIKDDNWTGADLSGVVEFDFKGGQISGTSVNSAAPSTAWYNGLMRLRLAAMTAAWSTPYGKWSILAGQEYGLVNPLFAESLAWVADPLFWQAGNLWRRSPQIRLSYAGDYGLVGLTVQAAMLSPADNNTGASAGVDYGYGNRSRQPNLEGRVAVSVKPEKDINATVGFGASTGARR